MSAFKQMTCAEKMQYAKKYSKSQVASYRVGKRNGWLECYHSGKINKNKPEFTRRKYTKEQFANLYDDLNKVKWK